MDEELVLASLAATICLALSHLFAGKLCFLGGTPRSVWLSMAGGVSVAYVFVHLLPELAEGQETLSEVLEGALSFVERHVYLVALLGLAVFYGLERAATSSRSRKREAGGEDSATEGVFWLHTASFGAYNFLIGYLLLHRLDQGLANLVVFSIAMLLHFVVNDYGLREHHKGSYTRVGRWLLAAAILAGWLIGLAADVSEAFIAVLTAFLAGGVVLNVLKEELPEERSSRFWAFAVGAAGYSALLIAL